MTRAALRRSRPGPRPVPPEVPAPAAGGRGGRGPRAPWLAPALILVLARLVWSRFVPLAAEDAYITFRYARHLASGSGLVYNPDERVFGFSSPLWTAWMAVSFLVHADPVLWARLSCLAADLVTLAVVVLLLRRTAGTAAAWCFAAFFAAWPYFAAVSVSGMENSLMVGLLAAAALANHRRSAWAGVAIAAVALVRPEGLAAAAVLALAATGRARILAAVLTAAGIAWLALYFGSPVPQSVVAKSNLYGTPGPWAGRFWWDWLSPFVFGRFPHVADMTHLFLLSVVLAPAVVLGARALWPARGGALAGFVGAGLAVWLGYVVLGVAFFWWYLAVPLAAFATLAAVGLPRLARGPALYVSCALLVTGLWTVAPHLYGGRAQAEQAFARIGAYLKDAATPGEKILLEPIGLIGYAAPLVVVDESGLVSPRVAARRLGGPGWYADVATSERPDWILVRRAFLSRVAAFAGAGEPFRAPDERDSLLARYRRLTPETATETDESLILFRRAP